jgi:phosphoglycolate phosphatase
MPYAAVLFDLDGTLLDTLSDIAAAANRVLDDEGYPRHAVDAYRRMVGEGVSRLFEQALPEADRSEQEIERCVERFRRVYGDAWNVETRPYDGVSELLAAIAERGLKMAVLSNKPHDFTRGCVAEYFPDVPLDPVLGLREGVPRKPDPAGALEIAETLGLAPARFLYLGDTAVDMKTALAAGMEPVGALWGFRSREELVAAGARELLRRPWQLLALIEGSDESRP